MVDVVQWLRRPAVNRSTSVRIAPSTPKIVCPHCERPLSEEHDDAGCRRRMSRRLFFGALAGGAIAANAAPVVAPKIVNALKVPIIATKGCTFAEYARTDARWTWESIVPVELDLKFDGGQTLGDIFMKMGEQLGPEVSDVGLKRVVSNWVTIEKE